METQAACSRCGDELPMAGNLPDPHGAVWGQRFDTDVGVEEVGGSFCRGCWEDFEAFLGG